MIKFQNILNEVDYKDIFSPETMALLKGKSGESLRQMWGNKQLMQAMTDNQRLLFELIKVEKDYRDELEMAAVQIVKDSYPIVDYAGINIEAQIVDMGGINLDMGEESEEAENLDQMPETKKRRIINGITQGASIRGAYSFLIFREYLNQIDQTLVDKYKELLNLTFGVFDDENAVAMMLAMLAQQQKMEGGSSEAEYDEENDVLTIKAKALCFPYLVHEIVKGLYEIVSLQGFGTDKEKNKEIVKHVDKLQNEPHDSTFGKFIYDAISNLYNQSNYDDPRIRELLFAEIYKLPDNEFISFVENAINNKLLPLQKRWVENVMKDIDKDLHRDDSGLDNIEDEESYV